LIKHTDALCLALFHGLAHGQLPYHLLQFFDLCPGQQLRVGLALQHSHGQFGAIVFHF